MKFIDLPDSVANAFMEIAKYRSINGLCENCPLRNPSAASEECVKCIVLGEKI